jgi:HAD superfamily hydrolase (TIGR01484 family)
MRYLALATDYDGTLAHHGRVDGATWAALGRLRETGRKVILVTGRELEDLQTVCPDLGAFDRVVAENGALLYSPAKRETRALAPPPSPAFVEALRRRGVEPISVGHTIVASWEPHEAAVLAAIRDLGLELQVIFNKGAVMVLPAGVNKATGLAAALHERGLSAHNVVGVGDAENDHAFLSACECGVAVANALPALRETADFVTPADHGAGVAQLVEELIANDLRDREPLLARHRVLLGHREDRDEEVRVEPYGRCVLVAGPSGSGKSTVTTGLMERLAGAGYQFCVIDPEGDYRALEEAVVLGDPKRVPAAEEVLSLLRDPKQNVVVNLLGVPLLDRPSYFADLLPRLMALRTETGRPHWLVLDEAHHLFPARWEPAPVSLPQTLESALLITVHPDMVAPAILGGVNLVLAVGEGPGETLGRLAATLGEPPPPAWDAPDRPDKGEVLAWRRQPAPEAPFRVKVEPGHTERRRHSRKYAEGELPRDRSFYFRGPQGKLNLRAHNLVLFLEMARGVDEETWLHHLRRGDYSQWFREAIKDPGLGEEAEQVERNCSLSAAQSRQRIEDAVGRRYTLSSR